MTKEMITPCYSPYSAPAMLVPEKNGKLRLVIGYRKQNEQTIQSCWPIPSIEEIFDTLQGSTYFTTIDVMRILLAANGTQKSKLHSI